MVDSTPLPASPSRNEAQTNCHAADILESLADPVVAFDREWRYTYVSRRAARSLGKTPEEMVGKSMWELFPADADTGFQDACTRAWAAGEPVTVERYSNVLDRWVESYIYPFEDGASTQWRDITGRKRAEDDLRASQERSRFLAGLLERADQPFGIGYPDGTVGFVNSAFERLTGYTREELQGMDWAATLTPPEWFDLERAKLGELHVTGQPVRYRKEYLRKDGTRVPIELLVALATDDRGRSIYYSFLTDLTERKRAEEEQARAQKEIEAARDLLETVIDHSPAGIDLVRGSDLTFQLVNPAYQALAPDKPMLGKTLREVWPEVPGLEEIFRHVLETGEPHEARDVGYLIRRSPTGPLEQAYFRWHLTRVRIPGEEGWGLLNTTIETTWRVRARESLVNQRELLRTTLSSIGDAVLATDAEGKITLLNPTASRLTGFGEEEALGLPAREVLHTINERTRESTGDFIGLVLREKRVVPLANHTALVSRDGREIPIEDSAAPIQDNAGNVLGAVLVFRDVTEKRRAEDALAGERARLRLALDVSHAGIWEWDVRTNENFWSEELWAVYGLEPHSCRPSYDAWRQVVDPQDRPLAEQTLQEAARNGTDINVEFRVRDADGGVRWLMVRGHPLRDADGQVSRFVGIAVDISGRRRAEEELRQSESRLRTLGDNLPEGVLYRYCQDAGGKPRFEFVSAGIERLTGIPAAEFISRAETIEQSILPEDYPSLCAAIEVSRERLTHFEVEVRRKHFVTGEVRWSLLRSTPTRHADGSTTWDGIELDITERKRVEEALRGSEAEKRALFDNMNEALAIEELVCDERGNPVDLCFLDVNPAYLRLAGKSRDEIVGRCLRDIWGIDRVPQAHLDRYALVVETGKPAQFEASFEPARIHAHVSAFHLGGPRFASLSTDITERKKAEEALRESEEKLRSSLVNAAIGFALTAPGGRYIDANPAYCALTGYTLDELRAAGFPQLIHPADCAAYMESIEAMLAGRIRDFVIENRYVRKDGAVVWVRKSVSLVRDAGGTAKWIIALVEDVGERKRSEEALRASEARERARAAELHAIMEAVPAAIFVARDPQCRSIFGNRMIYERLQIPEGRNLSMSGAPDDSSVPFRIVKDGCDPSPWDLPLHQAASTGRPVRSYEYRIVLEDGASYDLLGDAVPLLGEDGTPQGAVGAFLDITERKRTELQLRQAQKLESVGLLAGGIAHDFNNLLTGVMGNASLLLEDVGPEQADLVKSIMTSTERAAHLTRQLLAYSGKGQFIVRDLDISGAVNETADLMQFSIPKSVRLKLDLERRLPLVRTDPGQLQQILMNLVINAGEAIGEGNPGAITIATSMADVRKPFLDALSEEITPGRYASIEVGDTGSGIDPDQKARIFDPFFTTKFTGRGLGLAAVAGILRSLKGGITLESVPGQGSSFRVFLPIAGRDAEKVTESAAGDARATLLVVDDEDSVRNFICAVLRRKGYRVLGAADGREALDVCEGAGDAIDAAIVDIVMPNMGANEFLPALKARRPKVKILLTSGYSESEARRLCAAYPGARFIQKPYTAQRIAQAVADLIGVPEAN